MPEPPSGLPRVMRLSDVVLFNISAIVGLRWLTTAASQFGLASLLLWLGAMGVFFLPPAVAGPPAGPNDAGAGGRYRRGRPGRRARRRFVRGWGRSGEKPLYFPPS